MTPSRHLRITLSYNGSGFLGYQFQPHGKTVQGTLNEAWRILTRGEDVTLYACSRLDAGVHAHHFVLHLATACALDCVDITRSLNGILRQNLKAAISIYEVADVESDFHARFQAVGKHYRYLLWYGRGEHALIGPRAWHVRSRRPLEGIGEVARLFEGRHDFSAFRSQDCTAKTTLREIHAARVSADADFPELLRVDFFGEGFLKNMIRNIVGTSVDVATGKHPVSIIEEAFAHGDRTKVGQCAPAHALTLMRVYYDRARYMADAAAARSAGPSQVLELTRAGL